MSHFDDETAVERVAEGEWHTELTTSWDIGETANGGYAVSPVVRALRLEADQPDPVSVTTHFLRPVVGGGEATITTEVVRRGRSVSVLRGTLHQAGAERLVVSAVFGDVGVGHGGVSDDSDEPAFEPVPPLLAPPAECVPRSGDLQGVELPISSRIEVRLPAERMLPGGSPDAVSEGWIRFVDGAPPSSTALVLFADAFPPSLFSRLGRVGWVPTIELTVHVRRRPQPGWIQARFECDDLVGGRMVESGTLWDSTGAVVARSRQLGLLLTE